MALAPRSPLHNTSLHGAKFCRGEPAPHLPQQYQHQELRPKECERSIAISSVPSTTATGVHVHYRCDRPPELPVQAPTRDDRCQPDKCELAHTFVVGRTEWSKRDLTLSFVEVDTEEAASCRLSRHPPPAVDLPARLAADKLIRSRLAASDSAACRTSSGPLGRPPRRSTSCRRRLSLLWDCVASSGHTCAAIAGS